MWKVELLADFSKRVGSIKVDAVVERDHPGTLEANESAPDAVLETRGQESTLALAIRPPSRFLGRLRESRLHVEGEPHPAFPAGGTPGHNPRLVVNHLIYLDPGSGGSENDFTSRNTTFMTWNLMHVARMIKDRGGIPAHGNQRSKWEAGCRFDSENPEHR